MKSNRNHPTEILSGVIGIGAAAMLGVFGLLLATASQLVVEQASVPPFAGADQGLSPVHAESLRQLVASLPGTTILGDAPDEENAAKRVMLEPALFKAAGDQWPFHGPQATGDCAGFGFSLCVEVDQSTQISNGEPIEFHPVYRPASYAAGRFEGGRKVISGAGADPGLIVAFAESDGVLWADTPGLPPYSKQIADEWGNRGIPKQFLDGMKEYTVEDTQSCKTAQGVCNQLNCGHPVFFGSMKFGTTSIKLVDGRNVARDTTNWAHAQAVTGYDGTLSNGTRLFRVMNSWGPKAHNPLSQMTGDRPGGYYITWDTMESICKEQMCFSISGTKGFAKREVTPDFHILGQTGPGPVAEAAQEETATMVPVISQDWQTLMLASGCVLLTLSLLLTILIVVLRRAFPRGGGLKVIGASVALTLLLPPPSTWAIDFGEVLSQPAQNSAAAPSKPSSAMPSLTSQRSDAGVNFGELLMESPQVDGGGLFELLQEQVGAEPAQSPLGNPPPTEVEVLKHRLKIQQELIEDLSKPDVPAGVPVDLPPAPLGEPAVKQSYPLRGGLWSHPGVHTREQLIGHLRQGQHAGQFSESWLKSATMAELEAAHSDSHEGRLKPMASAKAVATAKGKWVTQKFCRGGVCYTQQVWVPE